MSEPTDNLEAVRRDIIALAQGLKAINDYHSRIDKVEQICIRILAPNPGESAAQEDLASFSAARQKLGFITSIIADWDEAWHFIFQYRFEGGYWQGDGFDLREGEPGYLTLLKSIELLKIDKSLCDLAAPSKAGTVPARRVIYPKAKEAVENSPTIK